MKAVLLAPLPPPTGGIAVWAERMLSAELKGNWEIKIVDEKASEKRGLFGNSKRSFFDEWKRCKRIWGDLKKAVEDDEVKVVHTNIPATTFAMMREYVCAKISKRAGKKFIVHFRCTVPNMRDSRFWGYILKKLCNSSDMIISLNEQTNQCLKNYTSTPIQIIPNFVSEEEIIKSEKTIKDEMKTVLYVGGGVPGKGCREVIDTALAFPEIEFRICGNCSTEIINYHKEKNEKNVILCGVKTREEVREELKNADVFIFLSYFRGEGFSNALAEAMAAGLPCLVTDWAANKDMIGDGGGFVVPIRDSKAAIEALKKMEPKEVREAQSKYNIEKVKNEYIDSVVIDKYVDLYESLL